MKIYTVGRPLSCNVVFCFLSDAPVSNRASQYLQYQPNVRWNMSKTLYKISRPCGRPTVYSVVQVSIVKGCVNRNLELAQILTTFI